MVRFSFQISSLYFLRTTTATTYTHEELNDET